MISIIGAISSAELTRVSAILKVVVMISIIGAISSAELTRVSALDHTRSHSQIHSKISRSSKNVLHSFGSDFRENHLLQFVVGWFLFSIGTVLLWKIDAAISGSIFSNLLDCSRSIRGGQLARLPIVVS